MAAATPLVETLGVEPEASRLAELDVTQPSLAEVRLGNAEFHSYLCSLILGARQEVFDYVIPEGRPDEHDPAILKAYATVLKRGLDTRSLISPEHLAMVQRTYDPNYEQEKFLRRYSHIRLVDQVHQPFTVIDGERVLLNMKDPLEPDEYVISICIWNRELAQSLRGKFLTLWDEAGRAAEARAAASATA